MRIRIRDVGKSDVLAGALTGRRTLAALLERLGEGDKEPMPVYLDFEGVEVATASFLRESILEFRTMVRRRTNRYPVVANASPLVAEELAALIEPHGDVLMLCSLDEEGRPYSPILVGDLDPKQRIAFDLVNELGETDAGELMRRSTGTDDVRKTAWNNRLASLSRLGVLMELSRGRSKRYRPLPLG